MMSIEILKQELEPEMEKVIVSEDFKTTANLTDGVIELYENPSKDRGDPLKWTNVELVLKPEIYILTGMPGSGKSTWLDNVIINSVTMHRYKWAIFSPESHPVEMHMKQLLEIYTETSFTGDYKATRTTKPIIEKAMHKLSRSLYMLTPTAENLTIEAILELIEFMITEYGVNAFVLDPYNEFSHTRPNDMTETEYVSRFLGMVRSFVRKHDVMAWIVAHPTKLRKEETVHSNGVKSMEYPIPTAYDIAGSANWFNKGDNVITVHRDKDFKRNPDNIVSINVQKCRRRTTGKLGSYELKFNYKYGSYKNADL